MSYPAGTLKYVVSGTLQGGEIFSFGFQTRAGAALTQADVDAATLVVSNSVGTDLLSAAVKAFMATTTVVTAVKSYYYGPGGVLTLQGAVTGLNIAGTSGSSGLPNQCALVITLLTGIPGRSNRGRVYLPLGVAGVLAGSQMTSANCTTILNAYKAMLTTINATTGSAAQLAVVASAAKGTSLTITRITVDTKLDVQRRRANHQTPTATVGVNV